MTNLGLIKHLIKKFAPKPSPAQISSAVDDYLDEHPELVAPIDDTAGAGDTGKIWSADKTASEISGLGNEIIEEIGIHENVQYTAIDGKYVNQVGNLISANGWSCTNPIAVNAGDVVESYAKGYTGNVCMIATTDSTGSTYIAKVVSPDSTLKSYFYTCDADGYVACSFKNSDGCAITIRSKASNKALDERVDAIEQMTGTIDATVSDAYLEILAENEPATIAQAGKYIEFDGDVQSSSAFNMYTAIGLPANSTLRFHAKGYTTNVALLAKVNEDGTYTPLIVSNDSLPHDLQYTTYDAINVVISSNRDQNVVYSIYTSKIDELDGKINVIEDDLFAFVTMGVIGDSLANGASNMVGTGSAYDRPDYSWGKFIERLYGVNVSLFALGGFTTRSWLSTAQGLPALMAADALDCYVIGLGQNDAYSLGDNYLGTISDVHVGSESENADTYYGNYSKIIAEIKTKAPNAKVFCLTNAKPSNETKLHFNAAIRAIVPLYSNTYLVDLAEDEFYSSRVFNDLWVGSHSTAAGYKLIAKNIHDNIVSVMRQNIADFTDIQWNGPHQTEIDALREAVAPLTPAATSGDVGKFLKAKTVSGGKVTEYEFDECASDPYGILQKAFVGIPVLNIISGKYINKTGGENTSSSYTCSDFIEYDYNVLSYITYNGTIYGEVSCAFYDENKVPVFILSPDNASQYGITPVRSVQSITVPVPANTKYVRISYLGTATSALFALKTIFLGKPDKLPESYLQGEDVTLVIGEYTPNKVLVNGVETAYSYSGKYITDYLPVTPGGYYMITGSADSGNDYYAFYDANKTFVSSKKSNTSNSAVVNELVKIPSNVAYVRVACKTSCSWCVLGACGSVTIKRKPDNTWHKRFMNIGYSSINVCPANTSETFRSVCRFGFNACKGDVEITSDGKLVMCHDSGFTFDGNGRITTYNSENNTLIADLTYAECLQKEYANQSFMLDYAHVCGFDEYLDVCAEFGTTAVVTIRGTRKDDVAKVVVERLKAHNLLDNCLVNSYNMDSLSIVHMLDSDIPLTLVLSTNTFPAETQIANAKKYGNMGFVGVFSGDNKQTLIENNATIIKTLNDSNIGFIYAQTSAVSEIDFARKHGFCGAHILAPVVPYQMKETKFKVKILNGTPTIEWWVGQNLFTATISATGNVISVSNFKKQGSASLYNDEIMEVWMNRMPYRITVRSAYNRNVSAVWEDNALKITTADITQYDVLTVIIEV